MTQFIAVILVLLSTLFSAAGSLMLKIGSVKSKNRSIKKIKFCKEIVLGAVIYALATIIFVSALRFGEVSILYPITSLAYIWISILSSKVLKEKIGKKKIIGICLIVIGVIIINL